MQVQLPLSINTAHIARETVTDTLLAIGRADLVDDTTVVVSELVANGVMHARTEMTLSVERAGDGIRVAVSDGSHTAPVESASPVATSGRGLLLVERLSSAWGSERLAEGGKAVWAQIGHAAAVDELTAEACWNGGPTTWRTHCPRVRPTST